MTQATKAELRKQRGGESLTVAAQAEFSALVASVPGLTLGYIGNMERWGDDRAWRIWLDASAGQGVLWCGQLTRAEVGQARQLVKAYQAGLACGLAVQR